MSEPIFSSSLALGGSFIPKNSMNLSKFCLDTIKAMEENPELAADICLAATYRILLDTNNSELRYSLNKLVLELCLARDQMTKS